MGKMHIEENTADGEEDTVKWRCADLQKMRKGVRKLKSVCFPDET
jgi:hypothetical protein